MLSDWDKRTSCITVRSKRMKMNYLSQTDPTIKEAAELWLTCPYAVNRNSAYRSVPYNYALVNGNCNPPSGTYRGLVGDFTGQSDYCGTHLTIWGFEFALKMNFNRKPTCL